VAVASILHYGTHTVGAIKSALAEAGVAVRTSA
jgi:imidazole glycerol phosphate synthase subunit HisF